MSDKQNLIAGGFHNDAELKIAIGRPRMRMSEECGGDGSSTPHKHQDKTEQVSLSLKNYISTTQTQCYDTWTIHNFCALVWVFREKRNIKFLAFNTIQSQNGSTNKQKHTRR